MTLDALRETLPAYAKDLSLNLSSLQAETVMSDQQKWGTFVASAYATGSGPVIRAMNESARAAGLSDEAHAAAKAAAAIMAMNNVYYRSLHIMHNAAEYRALPARLRMTIIGNPGVDKTDFELWCTAVSAINGCGMCIDAHEDELKKRGVPAAVIQATLRIGAVVNAVSRVIEAEAAAAA
jgi:alkyl hydroperoxide reductase subunit D